MWRDGNPSSFAISAGVTGRDGAPIDHVELMGPAQVDSVAGGRNFVHAILRRAHENGSVRVVTDEIGNPTYVADLAVAISRLITTGQYGVYHFVNSGACSRWAFANEILRLSGLSHVPNTPILSRTFSRPSSPPPFGELHNIAGASIGITLRPWAEALADFLQNEPAL